MLETAHLEKINIENLKKGLDSEGQDMPFYSDSEYGYEKTQRNPRNRGHWDLKNTGQYHSGIKTKISKTYIRFSQKYKNKKTRWLERVLDNANRTPLGITKQQSIDVQKKNIPKLRRQILNIIRNTK